MENLTQRDKKQLTALGHRLSPTVQIGKSGLTEAVIKTLNTELNRHELIKVQMLETSELDRSSDPASIAEELKATLIQTIGFKFVLYRHNPAAKKHALDDPNAEVVEQEPVTPAPKKSKRKVRGPLVKNQHHRR